MRETLDQLDELVASLVNGDGNGTRSQLLKQHSDPEGRPLMVISSAKAGSVDSNVTD